MMRQGVPLLGGVLVPQNPACEAGRKDELLELMRNVRQARLGNNEMELK